MLGCSLALAVRLWSLTTAVGIPHHTTTTIISSIVHLVHRLMHVDVVVRRNLRNIEMLSVGLTGRRTSSLCSGYVVRWRGARVKRLFLVRIDFV